MLFARADGRDFQLPGGDGLIVMIAGGWAALLVFYRLLDKPGLEGNERVTATVGVEWGIFVALLLALGLLYAGGRMRARERPEPPLRRRDRAPAPGDLDLAAARGGETRARGVDPDLEATVVEPFAPPRRRRSSALPVPAAPRGPSAAPRGPSAPTPSPANGARAAAPAAAAARKRPRYPPAPGEQLSFEDPSGRAEQ